MGWLAAATFCLTLGCRPDYCEEGVSVGRAYEVRIIELYDKNSQFDTYGGAVANGRGCGEFDLKPGMELVVDVKRELHGACTSREIEFREVPGFTFSKYRDAQSGEGGLMATSYYRASSESGCAASSWQVYFFRPPIAGTKAPTDTPIPGQPPNVVLARETYIPPESVEACRALGYVNTVNTSCTSYYVVDLDPMP